MQHPTGSAILDIVLQEEERRERHWRRTLRATGLAMLSAPILGVMSPANPLGGVVLGLGIAVVVFIGTAGGWRALGSVLVGLFFLWLIVGRLVMRVQGY